MSSMPCRRGGSATDEGLDDESIQRKVSPALPVWAAAFRCMGELVMPGGTAELVDDYGHHLPPKSGTQESTRRYGQSDRW